MSSTQDLGDYPAGLHNIQLETAHLLPGVYTIYLEIGSGSAIRKIVRTEY